MSLFGSSNTAAPAFTFPTPAASTAPSTSLFGSSTTTSKPLFGSTTQASSTPSLFGATTTSTSSGGLFGKSPSATTTTSSAGTLFGATSTAPTTSTPSLFGASSTTTRAARLLRLHNANRLGMSSLIDRRSALTSIDPSVLPKTSEATTSSTVTPAGTSSPARRNLFGAPDPTKEMVIPTLGTSSSVGLGGVAQKPQNFGVLAPKSSSASDIPTKMAAFRSGALGNMTGVATSFLSAPTPAAGANIASSKATFFTPSATTTTTTNAPSTTASLFGGAKATPFGASTTTGTTGTSLFGSTANKPATGGLFGSSTGTLGGLGGTSTQQQQVQQQNQQHQVIQQYHPFVKAVGNPNITGNDNDKHIANLNQVAAALGLGKAPYKDGNQVLTFNMEGNAFEKFVGIGYNKISERTDDEGVVSLVLRHPIENLNTEERKSKILEVISAILGNVQNVQVLYAPGTSLRQLPDGFTELCIIVKEGGFVIGACKVAQVLNDTPKMTQLESQLQVDKTRVLPKVGMSKAQKDRYLETVPDGIDERVWRQAIAENPAPNKLLPVAVRGWEALRDRQKAQESETKIYHRAMHTLADRVEKAGNDHARANVEMEQIRNRHKQLSYRLIRVLLAQWITARFGRQIDTDEDQIEAKCDTLLAQINRNHQIKFFVEKFYEILETKPDQLKESMFHQFDMKLEDEKYARSFLTQYLYVCEGLIATSNLQVEELEGIRRTLEG